MLIFLIGIYLGGMLGSALEYLIALKLGGYWQKFSTFSFEVKLWSCLALACRFLFWFYLSAKDLL